MNFKFRDIQQNDLSDYKKNFDIIEEPLKISYFNNDKRIIHIETALPNKKFKIRNVFNISNIFYAMVVIHVSDDKNLERRNDHREYIGELDIKYDKIINVIESEFTITNGEFLNVLIFNDKDEINIDNLFEKINEQLDDYFSENSIVNKFLFPEMDIDEAEKSISKNKRLSILLKDIDDYLEPREGGGGVIVNGP